MLGKNWFEILDKLYNWVRLRRNIVIALSVIFLISAGVFSVKALAVNNESSLEDDMTEAFFTYFDGQKIGLVKDKGDIEKVLEGIKRGFESLYNMEVTLENDIDFERVYVDEQYLSDPEVLESLIQSNVSPRVKCAVIQVNGENLAVLKDSETARFILDSLLQPFKEKIESKGGSLEEIDFEEDVNIKDLFVRYEELEDPDEVVQRFTQGNTEKRIYIVEKGDNIWTIAQKHDMTVKDILEANAPMEESDILQIGQELNLNVPELPLNVITVEKVEHTKSIPFETETKKSDDLYTNQTKVAQEGKEGECQIVEKVYKRNGVETERETISETVKKEPVKKIVLVGTKKPPKKVSSSRSGSSSSSSGISMSWPTRGRITSRFGRRWGRMHKGLDIANDRGTPIYAARSGTVCYSGYNGGYGNLVRIDHGSGIETYYAHLSSRSVKKGQKVKKGQLIGYMGNTGNSTGPHLHFEVRINGTPKNPLNYLK
ncbi:MAG: peptidoglycan DD-metalloendopeptidase family protein [Caldicoprobacterales bacterium]|jgi:murein DD-endopeptidase MepM/ murein hydrolase activator NlpD|nr:peptidoglycan DD-metalloendopeptidase family protein [Clostridiales bacterium]